MVAACAGTASVTAASARLPAVTTSRLRRLFTLVPSGFGCNRISALYAWQRPAPWARSGSSRCVRCSLLRPGPAQRARLVEIRDNLLARIAEAQREGWLGEVEGLRVSLAGAEEKLVQLDNLIARRNTTVNVGMPTFPGIVGRHVTAGPQTPTHARPKAHNVGDLGSWRTS